MDKEDNGDLLETAKREAVEEMQVLSIAVHDVQISGVKHALMIIKREAQATTASMLATEPVCVLSWL